MSDTLTDRHLNDYCRAVGWIGLGSMGLAMALNIQKHLQANGLPDIKYWNRTISKGDALKTIGGEPRTLPGDVALNSMVTFISVRYIV